jgi:hypothetical protein
MYTCSILIGWSVRPFKKKRYFWFCSCVRLHSQFSLFDSGRVHPELRKFSHFFLQSNKKNTMSGPLPLNVMARRVLGIARASIAAEMEQRRAFEAAEAEGNQVVSFFKNRGYVLK